MSGSEAPARRMKLAAPPRAAAPARSARLMDTRAAGSRGRRAAAGGAGASGEAEGAGRAASTPLDALASTPSAPASGKRRRTASTAEPAPAAKRARSGEAAVGLSPLQPRLNAQTGFRGVFLNKQMGTYQARLSIECQLSHCGYHETAEAAAHAYDAKARKQGWDGGAPAQLPARQAAHGAVSRI